MADSTDLPVMKAGDVRWGSGFHQHFQHKVNIFLQKHSYCREEIGYHEVTGTLGISFLLFAVGEVVYNPTKCMWHTDQCEDIIQFCHWWRWSRWTRSSVNFIIFFNYRVRTRHLCAQTECSNTRHQSERNLGACLLPVPFTSFVFPHNIHIFLLCSIKRL